MTKSRLVCYIDEAGCSGEQYDKGSSHFLAIGAAIYDRSVESDILAIFDESRKERGHSKIFNKFSKSSDQDNYVLTQRLASKPVRIVQIALHKPSMAGTFTRSNHKEEYQYLCKFMIERVSWIARDSAINKGLPDTKCQLIFSEQRMYPYEDLCAYFSKLKSGRSQYNTSAEWQYIDTEVGYLPHQNEHAIHIADIVASAMHRAIEPKKHGMTDDRFQRNLAPLVYRRKGIQYGVKLFPTKEILSMRKEGKFQFLDSI